MKNKLPVGTLQKLWSSPENWKLACLYVCKQDPRFIVPKRNKWGGWTFNFGRLPGWIALVLLVSSTLAPMIYLASTHQVHSKTWYMTLIVLVLLHCLLCIRYASPHFHEE